MELLSADQLRLVVKKKVEKAKLMQLKDTIIDNIDKIDNTYNLVTDYMSKEMKKFNNMYSYFENYFDSHLENAYYDTHKKNLLTKTKEELIDEMMENFLYRINYLENNNIEESYEDFHSIYADSCNDFIIKSVKIAIAKYYKDFLRSLGGNKND